jgi:chemotaxis protein CheZ
VNESKIDAEKMLETMKQAIREVLHEERGAVCQGLLEGKFYQNLAVEMENGIGRMYQEISVFKKALSVKQTADASEQIISDASDQLEAIVRTTEMATNQIMDAVEKCQGRSERFDTLVNCIQETALREELLEILTDSNQDYLAIVTSCAFQDLTGQRVKKVVELIKTLEKQIIMMLVKAGSKIRGKQAGKEDHEIEGETEKALAKLSGPQSEGVDQAGVDELLVSLGL